MNEREASDEADFDLKLTVERTVFFDRLRLDLDQLVDPREAEGGSSLLEFSLI